MTVLSREDVAKLEDRDAKIELAKYAGLLRTSLATIKALEVRVMELSTQVEIGKQSAFFTKEQIAEMQRRMFGDSSERRDGESAGPLFDATAPADQLETVTRKKRTKFGRRPQPELPRVEITHEIPEEQLKAEGLKKWDGQFETSEVVNVIPTQVVVEVHKQQKYLATPERKPDLPPIVTAPGPLKCQAGARYGLDFDIEVALGKYLWHLPLDRQVRMLAAQGLKIESQTLFSRIDIVAWHLEAAVMPRLARAIQASRVNLGDETTWKNLGAKPEHGKKKRFYLWAVRNDRSVCFAVYDGRSGKIAQSFLKDISGVLVVDGFRGYDALASATLIIARDWVHGRRKFISAEGSEPAVAAWFIAKIGLLFDVERDAKGKAHDEVRALRQLRSRPVVDEIRARLCELQPKTLPRSALGKAIAYMLTYWTGLTVFLDDPEVPIHTNGVEGIIRAPVVGRKNHGGSKNLKTAKVAAIFYSVIATCQIHGVDPKRYLHQAMRAILTQQPVPMPWDLAEKPKPPPQTVSETVDFKTVPNLIVSLLENGSGAASKAVS